MFIRGARKLIEIIEELLKTREISIDELFERVRLPRDLIMNVLRGIRTCIDIIDDKVIVKDPLALAFLLVKKGVTFRRATRFLDWQDFEKFSAEILSAHRYIVYTNTRLTKPIRLEIDVLGVDPGSGRTIVIDCKHWSRGIHRSQLVQIAEKHYTRTKKFLQYISWAQVKHRELRYVKYAVPIIVTLTTPVVRFHSNVLIVSVQELNQVLSDIHVVVETFGLEPIKRGVYTGSW